MNKRIGILTGGGDVQPLNAVLASAQKTAARLKVELVGYSKGWEGVLLGDCVDLAKRTIDPSTGGTVLKSSRLNIFRMGRGAEKIREALAANKIAGLVVVGGEDTLSNAFLLRPLPQVFIAKTIDNDVGATGNHGRKLHLKSILNYFTLGFPTAAAKIASFVSMKEGLRTTAYSHERIIVVEAMGMHAGWLALASGLGHPDFVIIPEFPLDYQRFLDKVAKRYQDQKHVIIVIAEGSRWKDGSYISAKKDEDEDIEHPRFGGAGEILRQRLRMDFPKGLKTRNINAVNPAYLYRSGAPSGLDKYWAEKLGERAIRFLADREEGVFLSVQKLDFGFKTQEVPLREFKSIDDLHRFVDKRFYDPEEFMMSEDGMKYMKEIAREFPWEKNYGRGL